VLDSKLVGATGRVFAVELERRNVAPLKANLWRHGCDNSVILPIAALRQRGFLPLRLNEQNRGDHQVGWGDEAGAFGSVRTPRRTARGRVARRRQDRRAGVDSDVIDGLSGLFAPDRPATIMCEFWLEGMAHRAVDPHEVLHGYRHLGFELGLLDESGSDRSASPREIVAAASAWAGLYVNVVLRRR
jgi:hypothetical protein